MTQPQHPFTDLPEGWTATLLPSNKRWILEGKKDKTITVFERSLEPGEACNANWECHGYRMVWAGYYTPNQAFQALRAAVREMANDLGVM